MTRSRGSRRSCRPAGVPASGGGWTRGKRTEATMIARMQYRPAAAMKIATSGIPSFRMYPTAEGPMMAPTQKAAWMRFMSRL